MLTLLLGVGALVGGGLGSAGNRLDLCGRAGECMVSGSSALRASLADVPSELIMRVTSGLVILEMGRLKEWRG